MTGRRFDISLAFALVLGAGCTTTAGPFITHIAAAGPGALTVNKCMVEYSPYGYAHIEMNECSTETVWLGGPPMGQVGQSRGDARLDASGRVSRPARVVSR